MAVFCIICSPIHVMLCKSELKVDGCNLRGSLAYVYLRSSFVHSEDKAQSREPGACKRRAGPECGLSVWPSAHHPPPGLCPLAQRGDTDWSSASIQARGVSARPLTPRHSLPQNGEWGGALEFQRLFEGEQKRITMYMYWALIYLDSKSVSIDLILVGSFLPPPASNTSPTGTLSPSLKLWQPQAIL